MCFGWTLAQQSEVEPNDDCFQPQDLTGLTIPLSVRGALEGGPEQPDIDAFRIMGAPGDQAWVELAGAADGSGTLAFPYLSAYSSACVFLGSDFDPQGGNARMRVFFPDDGLVVVEAIQCCGPGTYLLSVEPVAFAGSISGRMVDSETLEPLPGTSVELLDCSESCFVIASRYADEDGRFNFDSDFSGAPLLAGPYQIYAAREPSHKFGMFGPFEVGEGEHLDVGDLALQPQTFIGSVRGRVVDAISGEPVPVVDFPFSSADLFRCPDGPDSCVLQSFGFLDSQARFQFSEPFLPTGVYQVRANVDQYQTLLSEFFEVGEGENFDLGDLPATPFPVQFFNVEPCADVPSQGGTCRFRLDVRNGRANRFKGAVWGQVFAFDTGSMVGFTQFQIGKVGAVNPMPVPFNLAAGQSLKADLEFQVPGTVRDFALICLDAFAGEEPSPQFDTLGRRDLFCLYKLPDGGFRPLRGAEAKELLGKRRGLSPGHPGPH